MTRNSKIDIHLDSNQPGFPKSTAESDETNRRLAPYVSLAVQVLSDHDVEIEDRARLTLIVQAALSSRTHFFSAALHEPNQEELEQFFADFIVRCIVPRRVRCV